MKNLSKLIEMPVDTKWKEQARIVLENYNEDVTTEVYAKQLQKSKGWTVEMLMLGKALKTNPRVQEEHMTRAEALRYLRRSNKVKKAFGD